MVFGLPKHIKVMFIMLNVVFISIIMNSHILLIVNKPYTGFYIALWFAYGLPYGLPMVLHCLF